MKFDHIIIRYGEISTKKRNRKQFVAKMRKHILWNLKDIPDVHLTSNRERMYVILNGADHKLVIEQLKGVFGIQSLSPALKVERDVEVMKQAALDYVNFSEREINTFKINAKRADKTFPLNTNEINHLLGGYILRNKEGIKVDVKNPDLNLLVEVRKEAIYLTGEIIPGAGGLPIGSSGKAVLMLSGGIDSPVAGFLSMKRGLEIEVVHFFSPPYTSERAKQKVLDLAEKLAGVTGKMKVHIVPFTDIQVLIQQQIPDNYTMTTTRRLMLRLADEIRERNNALAIINGESLGQVASQTMSSMFTINEVTNTPILRPLIMMDKLEIIALAEKFGTLEISNLPYEDCCTIFTPSNPKTKPSREKANHYESYTDFEPYIEKALENTETFTIVPGKALENEVGMEGLL